MNLLRLLATGRSLVGLRETPSRYEMRTESLLPKFASKKNPFAPPNRPSVPAAAAPVKLETRTLFEGAAEAPRSLPPVKAVKTAAKPAAKIPAAVERKPVAAGAVEPAKTGPAPKAGWFKLLNPFAYLPVRRAGAGATARARPARSAVQAELSLEKVQVVRNDLNDADLEIVPGKLMGLPSGASPILARETRTEPTAWGRLTSRFLGPEHAEIR
jgi:hypothetical protein